MKNLTIQNDFRPEVPQISHIFSNIDYKNFRETLIKIDEILTKAQLEDRFIESAIEQWMISEKKNALKLGNQIGEVQKKMKVQMQAFK